MSGFEGREKERIATWAALCDTLIAGYRPPELERSFAPQVSRWTSTQAMTGPAMRPWMWQADFPLPQEVR